MEPERDPCYCTGHLGPLLAHPGRHLQLHGSLWPVEGTGTMPGTAFYLRRFSEKGTRQTQSEETCERARADPDGNGGVGECRLHTHPPSGSVAHGQASGRDIKAAMTALGSLVPTLKEEQVSSRWAWWVRVAPGAKRPGQRAWGWGSG